MPIHTVIQEKRKSLGLTQEQVAEYLGVSTPAVNKWEKGTTCPDITLLSPLARLLKIDLNTLLCFQEDLTEQEIQHFSNELAETAKEQGIEAGFLRAKEILQEYPNSDSMLHMFALILEGSLVMSEFTPEQKEPYEKILMSWYERVAENEQGNFRNNALYMLTGKYLQKEELEKARETLEQLPERSGLDKRILQAQIYRKQERMDEAAEILERVALTAVTELHNVLVQLSGMERDAGEAQRAHQIAEISEQTAELFHLWGYSHLLAKMELAIAEKREEESVRLLRQMLEAVFEPWGMKASPVFCRIAPAAPGESWERLLPPLLTMMEHDPEYDFLRETCEFQELLEEYRAKYERIKENKPL